MHDQTLYHYHAYKLFCVFAPCHNNQEKQKVHLLSVLSLNYPENKDITTKSYKAAEL